MAGIDEGAEIGIQPRRAASAGAIDRLFSGCFIPR